MGESRIAPRSQSRGEAAEPPGNSNDDEAVENGTQESPVSQKNGGRGGRDHLGPKGAIVFCNQRRANRVESRAFHAVAQMTEVKVDDISRVAEKMRYDAQICAV